MLGIRSRAQDVANVRVAQERSDTLLHDAVLATLTYHDLLDMPLTAVEVWRYLIRPRMQVLPSPTIRTIQETLEQLVQDGILIMEWGFYTFPGRERSARERIDRHQRAQPKWQRLRRVAWWLQTVPFLRMVGGSGSLAREVVREESDLDVLLVAQPGRIWTVRFLVTVLLDLFRIRRRPTGPTTDRICLNHYLSLDGLHLPYQSLYTAYECVRLVPLFGEDICRRFREENRPWLEQFLVRVLPEYTSHQKSVSLSPVLRVIQEIGEWILQGRIGDMLEGLLGKLQMRRIRQSRHKESPGRVIATAERLEFHPRSPEAPLLAAFNACMTDRGLQAFGGQQDSGLSKKEA